ncbi:MAG: phenylalanine--tRNA ligase subunit beta, partial [bacterium]
MRISTEWLGEFTDIPENITYLADRLTDIGLEVEQVIRLDRDIENVQVAEVIEAERHPDKPHLTICEVTSEDNQGQVVTAAPRVRPGYQYLWAIPGSRLPGQQIEKETMAGVESDGMLCSSRELGLTREAQTLLVIPEEFSPGSSAVEVLNLADPILELDLTPNRSDCLSHLGVARDFAAAEGLSLSDPRPKHPPEGPETEQSIRIDSPGDCPSYTGIQVQNVSTGDSPFHIQKRILKMGLRPLNNIVDITNYCLFEVGHPLHPFDADKLGDSVVIRKAYPDEELATLDGETRELNTDDLVIANDSNPVALAGIMGGQSTEVGRGTNNLFLEGAYFDPSSIRRGSNRHKLHTEASHRFERGTDPVDYRRSLYRCAELIQSDPLQDDDLTVHCPEESSTDDFDQTQIKFNPDQFNDLIGFNPGEDVMSDQLTRLGIEVEDKGDTWNLSIPYWRHDIQREEDIVEEIVRLHGYDKIPVEYPSISLQETPVPKSTMPRCIR